MIDRELVIFDLNPMDNRQVFLLTLEINGNLIKQFVLSRLSIRNLLMKWFD